MTLPTSEAVGIIPTEPFGARRKAFVRKSASGTPTPTDTTPSPGVGMQGRPRTATTKRRTALFISLLADNVTLYDAIVQSGIQPLRAVRLFCQPDFQIIVNAVRVSGGQVAVVVETEAAA